ncbi:MAG: UDP-glucose dehydrogenase family protein [Candidatus Nanopelagicaceae bacterium]
MKISVIGAGYLGATHAICMASLGHDVIAVDIDPQKIALFDQGVVPFFEPGLTELLSKVKKSNLTFSTNFSDISECDMHFLCIGTPQSEDGLQADLRALESAFNSVIEIAKPESIIVGKSTVPVGTAERFAATLNKHHPDVLLNWNPEFLREGHAIADTLKPNRIVIGARTEQEAEKLATFYREISPEAPLFITNFPTAELVKVAANAFLATKISFINAMSEVADATGADVSLLADAIGADDRIGRKFLGAGIGFGGGCLPKDIRAFLARADELGLSESLQFLREFDLINQRARVRAIAMALKELGAPQGKKVAVLGAAFKPDSDDVRDSPALEIAETLHTLGAHVVVHDPRALESATEKIPELTYSNSIEETLTGADLTMHLTEWTNYRELDPTIIRKLVNIPTIFDGRNVLDATKWQSAGWKLLALGRAL